MIILFGITSKIYRNKIRNVQSLTNRIYKGGPGGINSYNNRVITVFGANGFLGTKVVAELGKTGSQIIIPYRGTEQTKLFLRIAGDLGQVHLQPFEAYDIDSVKKCLEYSDTVISCVGNHVHRQLVKKSNIDAPRIIARAVAQTPNIKNFIHVSSLTQNQSGADILSRTKYVGERLVRLECPDAVIVRPASMYDNYDNFATYIMKRRSLMAYFALAKLGNVIKRPISMLDAGAAIAKIAMEQKHKGCVFELYDDEEYYLSDITNYINIVSLKMYSFRPAYLAYPLVWAFTRLLSDKSILTLAFLPPTIGTNEIPSRDARIFTFKDLDMTPTCADEGIRRAITFYKSSDWEIPDSHDDYMYEQPDIQLIPKKLRDRTYSYT